MFLNFLRKAALLSLTLLATSSYAQLSTNPDKFLGNITTNGSVNPSGIEFGDIWNQITPENESKWSSVEGSKGNYSFGGCDNCVNYAKNHKFPFKFHCFIWGSQYPGWIDNLTPYERYKSIVDWMNAAQKRYPKVELIDVVNEAVAGHQPNTPVWYQALGGQGESGFDWIVKAFDMAYERFPESILIYNDFNTFQWNTTQYIDLVTKLRDMGAPIDAYGCQSHDLTDCSASTLKNSMNNIQNSLKMPMYISEYDLGTKDDTYQKNQLAAQFPLMWEADYCAGITFWGYIYGATWIDEKGKDENGKEITITKGISGLIKGGVDRPAMTWLREYMATDKAKNAKSPFPGMKKPISLYIRPHFYKAPINEPNELTITAKMHNGATVEKVELYVNNTLKNTITEPTDATKGTYTCYVTPTSTNKINLKAIVYTNDGKTYERLGGFYGNKWQRKPFGDGPTVVPGVLEAEDFDMGGEGISYHSSRTSAITNPYRDDQEKASVTTITDGYCLEAANADDWYDYTLNVNSVKLPYEAIVGTMETGGSEFTVYLYKEDGTMVNQAKISVPYTGRKTFTKVTGSIPGRLTKGANYRIRIHFTKGKSFIDKIYLGTTEEAMNIEDVNNQPEGTCYTVYSTMGAQVGQIDAQDNADAVSQISNLTNAPGIYIIKNNASGKSKTVAVK